ncbi:MAG: polysaccharide ABC transporter ATP-binding protein [Acidobacteriota bacterium]
MTTSPIVSAADLSKTYRVYSKPLDRVVESLPWSSRPRHRAIEALKDVGFEVGQGESLGIVGENGAGKSTLLKILSGVTLPTRGSLEVRGRVASMLELGMGFHTELTGRQNIRLNAAMMGFSDEEAAEKTPKILDFAELGDFIDRPVKTYSSGMAMRLGFAISAQVEPDVLIIDEALSVGDGYFQKKCMDRIRELLDGGCTFLFCSHAMYYVSAFCQRALWLRGGTTEALGPAEEVVREYEHFLGRKNEGRMRQEAEMAAARGPAWIESLSHGERLDPGEPLAIELELHTRSPSVAVHVAIGLDLSNGTQVCAFSTHRDGLEPLTGRSSYRVSLALPAVPIHKGELDLYVFVMDEEALHAYDQRIVPQAVRVDPDNYSVGLLDPPHSWQIE